MPLTADFFQQTSKILTVAELTRAIRGTLETKFGAVWVQGEVSNYKLHPSGHQYFTLKDQRAQIACVIFRNTMAPLRQPLADGAQVQVYGNVSVFEARGQYQLSVQILQPRGLGLLQAKFEALKRKLEAEGLFGVERKRPLPKFPRRIGIVTSPSGAAIRDMLNVLQRRAPWLEILINPVRVQGAGAASEIAVAIRELATLNVLWPSVDLIIVARGGGSMEDLWAFNEEIVARVIADVDVPIVCFLEHQKTRLRFLSERTLARELLKRMHDAQQQIDLSREALHRHVAHQIDYFRKGLLHIAGALQSRSPVRELSLRRNRFADLQRRFVGLPSQVMERAKDRFRRVEGILRVLGPEATLRRGYSITTNERGKLIRTVKSVEPRMRIHTRLSDGEFESTVS